MSFIGPKLIVGIDRVTVANICALELYGFCAQSIRSKYGWSATPFNMHLSTSPTILCFMMGLKDWLSLPNKMWVVVVLEALSSS